ncbi:MAG: hypothetical protein ACKO41_00760 [Sphingomonadales bacterium]
MQHRFLSVRLITFLLLATTLFMCTKKDQVATADNEPSLMEKKFFTANRTQNDDGHYQLREYLMQIDHIAL